MADHAIQVVCPASSHWNAPQLMGLHFKHQHLLLGRCNITHVKYMCVKADGGIKTSTEEVKNIYMVVWVYDLQLVLHLHSPFTSQRGGAAIILKMQFEVEKKPKQQHSITLSC